jgi:hypothetical protein
MPQGNSLDVKEGDPVLAASYGNKDAVQEVRVVARKEFAGPWEYLLENAIITAPPIERFSRAALIDHNDHLVGIGYFDIPFAAKLTYCLHLILLFFTITKACGKAIIFSPLLCRSK